MCNICIISITFQFQQLVEIWYLWRGYLINVLKTMRSIGNGKGVAWPRICGLWVCPGIRWNIVNVFCYSPLSVLSYTQFTQWQLINNTAVRYLATPRYISGISKVTIIWNATQKLHTAKWTLLTPLSFHHQNTRWNNHCSLPPPPDTHPATEGDVNRPYCSPFRISCEGVSLSKLVVSISMLFSSVHIAGRISNISRKGFKLCRTGHCGLRWPSGVWTEERTSWPQYKSRWVENDWYLYFVRVRFKGRILVDSSTKQSYTSVHITGCCFADRTFFSYYEYVGVWFVTY